MGESWGKKVKTGSNQLRLGLNVVDYVTADISVNFLQLLVGPTTKDQTKNTVLNPPIEAQYFRINPQYWSYSLMCLKTELYGCSGEQGKRGCLQVKRKIIGLF